MLGLISIHTVKYFDGYSPERSFGEKISLSDSGIFCHLLITFAKSLDPGQPGENFRPDRKLNIGPKSKLYVTLMVFLIDFYKLIRR